MWISTVFYIMHILCFYAAPDDLLDVLNEVDTLEANWRDFALQLGLGKNTINSIEADRPRVRQCLTDALDKWLCLNYEHKKNGRPSWRRLAVAVSKFFTVLSEEIMRRRGIPI